jgi:lipoprotein-anchoring transpeptidase ErfK/SrfK
MRSLVVFVGGGLCAALLFWVLGGGRREPAAGDNPGSGGGEAPAAAPQDAAGAEPAASPQAPVVVARSVFFAGDASREAAAAPSAPAAVPVPAAAPAGATADVVPGTLAVSEERALARSVFDNGDRRRGARMLEEIYRTGRDKPQVDLSGEVERLLEAGASPEQRREYVQYLARFDKVGRVLEDLLDHAAQQAEKADDDAAAARSVWDDLSLAHEISRDAADRARVLEQLVPFLRRHVFGVRPSPLLASHAVQPGESLFTIAARYQTTVDALRRLNGLKNDNIQPRHRLRILEGKVKVFVDKSDFRLWTTVDGRLLLELPVGLGKDNATPAGSFVIRVKQKDPPWWKPGGGTIPAGDPENVLGSRWMGFEETRDFTGYGIHGTQDPTSVGKESSAGCIRLRNEDVELLFDFVPYGTEVVIRP